MTFSSFKYLFFAFRPQQWLKNTFVLLPLVFGRKMMDPGALCMAAKAFFCFSLVSSGVYLLNDIVDLGKDAQHPIKKLRPLAAGKITLRQAFVALSLLMVGGIISAFLVKESAGWTLSAYLLLNVAYMAVLKKDVIVDVFCIAGFFYLRILMGAVVIGVSLSEWMVLCTVLLALFLGLNKKRYDLQFSEAGSIALKKYNAHFIDQMISVVASTIVMAYAFYAMDTVTMQRNGNAHILYTVPFVYYGLFRYLYLVSAKGFGGDPARVLIRDRKMQLSLVLWFASCVAVLYGKL